MVTTRKMPKALPAGWAKCTDSKGNSVYVKVANVQGAWITDNGYTVLCMDGGAGLQVQEFFGEVVK